MYAGFAGFAVLNTAAQTQMPAPMPGQKAGEFFKNVTASSLKDLSVDDFISAMGVVSAALGYDCADCHPGAGSDNADFVTDANPIKKRARKMIEMVAAINKDDRGSGRIRGRCPNCRGLGCT